MSKFSPLGSCQRQFLKRLSHGARRDSKGFLKQPWIPACSPSARRTPAPDTQAKFGALMRSWVHSGAGCPPDKAPNEQKQEGDILRRSAPTPDVRFASQSGRQKIPVYLPYESHL